MSSASPRTAYVATDTGRIDFPEAFHHPAHATWTPTGGDPERIEGLEPVIGTGLGNAHFTNKSEPAGGESADKKAA